jgi:hypothetical protein
LKLIIEISLRAKVANNKANLMVNWQSCC